MKKPLSLLLAVVLLLALAVPAYADAANKVETKSGVVVMHAEDWKDAFPKQYETWLQNSENDEIVDYLEQYPYLRTLYEGYGFAIDYGSARGHFYNVQDIEATGRPHPLANCWTCKTPDFTNMVNEEGISAYQKDWTEVQQEITDGISCYSCHANTGNELVVTHTYLSDTMGSDIKDVDPSTLSCGQCHVEYYFAPSDQATTLPYTSLATMNPDDMLAFYNEIGFVDYENPRTGTKQLKAQHPEFETFMGEGSAHASLLTCADCHMGETSSDRGYGTGTYSDHYLASPLEKPEILKNTCARCHTGDVAAMVHAVQDEIEGRTNEVGVKLVALADKLAAAVESGSFTEEKLDEVRQLHRNAQFYWDFVFVENSEGAHNSALSKDCLNKSEALIDQAMALLG